MDATALACDIAQRRTTAPVVMDATLARADAQADLGAVARLLRRDKIPAGMDGPLRGVPMLAKDLGSHAQGLAPCAGSTAMRARVTDPPEDSDFFKVLRARGLIPIGLSTTPEFGFALSSEPPVGQRQPWLPVLSQWPMPRMRLGPSACPPRVAAFGGSSPRAGRHRWGRTLATI